MNCRYILVPLLMMPMISLQAEPTSLKYVSSAETMLRSIESIKIVKRDLYDALGKTYHGWIKNLEIKVIGQVVTSENDEETKLAIQSNSATNQFSKDRVLDIKITRVDSNPLRTFLSVPSIPEFEKDHEVAFIVPLEQGSLSYGNEERLVHMRMKGGYNEEGLIVFNIKIRYVKSKNIVKIESDTEIIPFESESH